MDNDDARPRTEQDPGVADAWEDLPDAVELRRRGVTIVGDHALEVEQHFAELGRRWSRSTGGMAALLLDYADLPPVLIMRDGLLDIDGTEVVFSEALALLDGRRPWAEQVPVAGLRAWAPIAVDYIMEDEDADLLLRSGDV